MVAQEHPVEHFRLTVRLAEDLRALPAQIVKHAHEYDAFGSWGTTVRRRGQVFRIAFDGKERRASLEREPAAPNGPWTELSSLPTTDQGPAPVLPDIAARPRET